MATAMRELLEPRRLRYYRAIAECGSISAAARSLNIAQPALSYHISELEARIGTRLLDRHRNGVTLTDEGTFLLRYAMRVADLADRAEAELLTTLGRNRDQVRLRLAIISSVAAALTPAIAADAVTNLPEVQLRISETNTMDSLRLMRAGEIDAAIHLVRPRGVEAEPIAYERLSLVTCASDPGSDFPQPIRLVELAGKTLILPARGNPLRDFLEQAAMGVGIKLRVALEIDGLAPRRNAIAAGLGTTVFGAHSVSDVMSQTGLLVQPIVGPVLRRPIYLCIRSELDRDLARRLRALLVGVISGPAFRFDGIAPTGPELPPCP